MTVSLFDASYYRAANPDLKGNSQALSAHFESYGLNEGRAFSPLADLNFYRASNSDLGSLSNRDLYEHLREYGVKEGRRFSPVVDLDFYRAANPDLPSDFKNERLFGHLRSFGLEEGRQFSQFFNVNYYKSANSDLAAAGFTTNRQFLIHFQQYGLNEGRTASIAFDVNAYKANNADLATAGLNNAQLFNHFGLYGLAEGRQSTQSFSVSYYRANNADLASFNNSQAYNHYVLYGHSEGRLAVPPSAPTPVTSPGSSSLTSEIGSSLSNATNIGTLGGRSSTEFGGTTSNSNFYSFTLTNNTNVALTLYSASDTAQTGLNAQLSLIQDTNSNSQVDTGEQISSNYVNLKPAVETTPQFSRSLGAGTYFVHVFPGEVNSSVDYSLRLTSSAV